MPATVLLEIAGKAAAILAVAACLVRVPLRRSSASLRHFVWSVALIVTLVLPGLVAFGPSWHVSLLPAGWIGSATMPRMPAVGANTAPRGDRLDVPGAAAAPAQGGGRSQASVPPPRAVWLRNVPWQMLIVWAWIAGVIVGLLRLTGGLVWAAWIARRAAPADDDGWPEACGVAGLALGLRRKVPVLVSDMTGVPVTCGLVKCRLLVPPDAAAWDDERRHIVLLHELAHVKRRDCLVQALAQAACAVHWYNPLAWMAARRLRGEQERACDDLVLSTGVDGPEYARQLHDIVGRFRASAFPAWATLAMARPSQFEGRVLAILDDGLSRRSLTPASACVFGAIAVAACVPLGALQLGAPDPAASHAPVGEASILRRDGPILQPQDARAHVLAATDLAIAKRPQFAPEALRNPIQLPEALPDGMFRIDDVTLASQLSFFLWSSIPDEELLTLAARERLNDAAVLDTQVRRMLRDPRSSGLVTNFFAQWLSLANLSRVKVDATVFPEWDDNLRDALRHETELFLQAQVREDRTVLELLTADYTFINERLAGHYAIPNISGDEFRRVRYPDDRRAGILGHGSILAVTSYVNRTSPVVRGKWIRENLLGVGVPAPPANVPPLKNQSAAGSVSVRRRMQDHAKNPVCASCHSQMDGLGFALENFDAVGHWRDAEGDEPINASGSFPDGTQFNGPAELRALLLEHRDSFFNTVTEKLLTYALGRKVEYYDMPAVRRIVREADASGHTWSSIVAGIVKSAPFQLRKTS